MYNPDTGICEPTEVDNGAICTFRNGTTGHMVGYDVGQGPTNWRCEGDKETTAPTPKPGDACNLHPDRTDFSVQIVTGVINAEGKCVCPDNKVLNANGECVALDPSKNCTMSDGAPGTLGGSDGKACTGIPCTASDGTKTTLKADGSCPGKGTVQCPSGSKLGADGKTCEPDCVKNGATGKLVNGGCVYAGDECDLPPPDTGKGIWSKDFKCEKKPENGKDCEVVNGQKGVYENGMCRWPTKIEVGSPCTGTNGKQGKMTADGKCDDGSGTVTPPKEQTTCTAAGSVGLSTKGIGVVVNGTCTVYTRPDGQTYFPPGTINPPQVAAEAAKAAASGIPKWGIAVAAVGGAVVLAAVAVTLSCQCEWDHDRHKLRRKKKKRSRRDEEEARWREEERIREDERKRMSMLQMQQQQQQNQGLLSNPSYGNQQQQYYDPYRPR